MENNNNEQFFKDAIMNLTSMKNSFLQFKNNFNLQ